MAEKVERAQFVQRAIDVYPEELLKGRINIEGNVIGCLMQDLLLFDDCNLKSDYFITKDAKFYYEMIEYMRTQKKLSSLDELSVVGSLNEDQLNRFNEYGGWSAVEHLQEITNTDNFDTYLDDLYRENTICRLYDDGFNLMKPVRMDDNKEVIPIKIFRKMSAQEVLDWYDARMSMYPLTNNSKVLEEGEINFDDDFIESCESGEEDGVSFEYAGYDVNGDLINCYPFLSRQISGLVPGTSTYLGGYSSAGKSSWQIGMLASLITQGHKVLIISNEEKLKDYSVRFLVWILAKVCRYYKVNKKKVKKGQFDEEDKHQIAIARKWFDKNIRGNLKVVVVAEMDANLNNRIIRKEVLKYGFDTVLIDTIKYDFNAPQQQRADLDLVKLSNELNAIAMKYDLIMLCDIQLAIWTQGQLFLDASVLSNAKQIKEILTNLFLMRVMYPEELDPANKKFFCHPFRLVKENDRWIEKPWTLDKTKIYRVLFVDKCRTGVNSNDSGVAYILQYDGDHCVFREVAQARVCRGWIVGSNKS